MAGEIAELVREDLEDRGIELDAADTPGAEIQRGKNVAAAAHADHGDVVRLLHQIGRIDHVVPKVGQLAEIAGEAGDGGSCIRVDIEIMLLDRGLWLMGKSPAEREGLSNRLDAHARKRIPAFEQRAALLDSLGPDHAEMGLAGRGQSGVCAGHNSQCGGDERAPATAANVVTAANEQPAGSGRAGRDPERGADRVDQQENKDHAEASDRRAHEVGGIEPPAAERQPRQEERDADAAFGEGSHERDSGQRQNDRHQGRRCHQRTAQKGNHGADAAEREPARMPSEFSCDALRCVAVGLAVHLHRPARQPEHGERNRSEGEVVIQHHAEEARDQDLVGKRGRRQHEDRDVVTALNVRAALQDAAPEKNLPDAPCPSRNARR